MPKKELYPRIEVVFKPDGPHVNLTMWEKITARKVEKAVREINKARRVARKMALREIRLEEAKNAGRSEGQEREWTGSAEGPDSSADAEGA